MKNNKKIILGILLSLSLLLILLFPPYTIENRQIKFFDFIFNSETAIIKLDKTYEYQVNSLERSLRMLDTIDAISIVSEHRIDTLFKYIKFKEYPIRKVIPKSSANDLRDIAAKLNHELKYRFDLSYNRKEIDKIIPYNVTTITKPIYIKGERQILINQLIIQIFICLLVFGMCFLALILFLRNKSANTSGT
jgi:hypothetical protein